MGERREKLNAQRNAAKVGMGTSMAVLVYTGFKRGRHYMNMHTWAGMALLGFTLWHVALYRPRILASKPAGKPAQKPKGQPVVVNETRPRTKRRKRVAAASA